MDIDIKLIQLIEQGGFCQMLLHLLEHPQGAPKSDYRKAPLYLAARTINRNLLALYNTKLIVTLPDPIQATHKLTEEGIEIAKKVKDILQILHYLRSPN